MDLKVKNITSSDPITNCIGDRIINSKNKHIVNNRDYFLRFGEIIEELGMDIHTLQNNDIIFELYKTRDIMMRCRSKEWVESSLNSLVIESEGKKLKKIHKQLEQLLIYPIRSEEVRDILSLIDRMGGHYIYEKIYCENFTITKLIRTKI